MFQLSSSRSRSLSRSRLTALLALAALLVVGYGSFSILGSQPEEESTSRLSISPYGVFLDGGSKILMSGFEGPVRLPGNGGVPNISFGFTIPNDYVPTTPLLVEILWETPATECNFVFGTNFMFRAADGQSQDLGSPSGGFTPLDSSTEFAISEFKITAAAPAEAHKTALLRFQIAPTPGEFDSMLAGDAVNLSLGRLDRDAGDTCSGEAGIAGISIVYSTK